MSSRIESIDKLRGLVILLMALDHTRDFLYAGSSNPRDTHEPLLFMTRWITHLCAPTFIFLAGISIYLWQQKHTKKETSHFIFLRGLWLVFLEFTFVRVAWTFDIIPGFVDAQVIWAIGMSMVFMSLTIYLPVRWLALLSGIMIAGHNVFDFIKAENLGSYKALWIVLHEQAQLTDWHGMQIFVTYPLIPWLAVLSLGYCCGGYFLQPQTSRIRYYFIFGISSVVLFIALRFSNYYGDPMPWLNEGTMLTQILSFINCEKYPASLLYLLMTLGLASLLLVLLEKAQGKFGELLLVFGRVPLLFYIVHIVVIHVFALALAAIRGEDLAWLFIEPFSSKPSGYGYSLAVVYLIWIIVIACLYPVCRSYWSLKQKHNGLFRYL